MIESIKQIVVEAGKMMLDSVSSEMDVREKTSPKDLITKYDEKIQNKITEKISRSISNVQFISEESMSFGDLTAENLFIIDPIDGTTNFIHSMGYSAVSVAWYKKGAPFYGIVYNPYSGEIYEAQYGSGAFLNGKRIKVGSGSLKNSIVTFGTSPYNLETTDTTFEMIKNIYGKCRDIRRMGAASLDICQVASGRIGLYFEAALSLWDYAAAQIILNEAGGKIVDFTGKPIPLTTKKSSVIVGREDIIAESDLIRKERTL